MSTLTTPPGPGRSVHLAFAIDRNPIPRAEGSSQAASGIPAALAAAGRLQ
jgi:hypothetical protein